MSANALLNETRLAWGPDGDNQIELSVHKLPAAVIKELALIFPAIDISKVLAVPTCQHARADLVRVGPAIEDEKDRLLETFMEFASHITAALATKGFWADYIDPCSGLAVNTKDTCKYYDEVHGMQSMLKYDIMNAGCCKILLHPVWGSSVYPATIFTTAPFPVLESVIKSLHIVS